MTISIPPIRKRLNPPAFMAGRYIMKSRARLLSRPASGRKSIGPYSPKAALMGLFRCWLGPAAKLGLGKHFRFKAMNYCPRILVGHLRQSCLAARLF